MFRPGERIRRNVAHCGAAAATAAARPAKFASARIPTPPRLARSRVPGRPILLIPRQRRRARGQRESSTGAHQPALRLQLQGGAPRRVASCAPAAGAHAAGIPGGRLFPPARARPVCLLGEPPQNWFYARRSRLESACWARAAFPARPSPGRTAGPGDRGGAAAVGGHRPGPAAAEATSRSRRSLPVAGPHAKKKT